MRRDRETQITRLTSQFPSGLIGLPGEVIRLSWQVVSTRAGAQQVGHRIQVASDLAFEQLLADETVSDSADQIAVMSPGPALTSRETQFFRVGLLTEMGWTDWSPVMRCEAGLLNTDDWQAVAIGDDSRMGSPSPILRREITLRGRPKSARLYVTSMGLNDFYINGKQVGESYLNPGWTAYQNRLLVETHDVTEYLQDGENCLGAILSDGWWRGKFGFTGGSEHYGSEIGLLAQLEVTYDNGDVETFCSDENWKHSTGEVQFSSIYDGTTIDFNKTKSGWNEVGFISDDWLPVTIKDLSLRTLAPRITHPVVRVAELPLSISQTGSCARLAGSQNISGWVKLVVEGKAGQTVVVRHAEVLEPDGKLHTRALRSAKATDTYILARDGRVELEPRFTFHGFQFAEVQTEAIVVSATAVAISSKNDRRGLFETSNARLNRLHENVVWSQLDNFVSIPTDCPQRDERMGWTGDAQAFCSTSNTLFDTHAFWRSWLIDLEIDQFENGDVSAVVPDILKLSPAPEGWIFEGRAGWADAATIVPFSVYEYFGDPAVLRNQLGSMRRWVTALDKRREGSAFLPHQFQFGDWCDPDAPADKPWESKVSPDFVANCYFAHSLDLLAKAEGLVGDAKLKTRYENMAIELKRDIWRVFGYEAIKTTAGCSIALEFAIAPEDERPAIADRLAGMVEQDQGMITTGFLTTPLVLHALSKGGHIESAYKMLFRREFRSWLYAVDKGATTIWERWDAIREDGSIHTGTRDDVDLDEDSDTMISFNHYAYGAVIDWVYRNLAGLAPTPDSPGFAKAVVAPKPTTSVDRLQSSIETPFGRLSILWSIDAEQDFSMNLEVPFGALAIVELPTSDESKATVNGVAFLNGSTLEHGSYEFKVSRAQIVAI